MGGGLSMQVTVEAVKVCTVLIVSCGLTVVSHCIYAASCVYALRLQC